MPSANCSSAGIRYLGPHRTGVIRRASPELLTPLVTTTYPAHQIKVLSAGLVMRIPDCIDVGKQGAGCHQQSPARYYFLPLAPVHTMHRS